MKKALVVALSSFLLVGCGSSLTDNVKPSNKTKKGSVKKHTKDVKFAGATHIDIYMSQKKVAKKIMEAGEKVGWRMTEFKENSIIAENFSNNESKLVTITFTNEYFDLTPNDNNLRESIKNSLEQTQE
jgi:PBP1b-binding outer membrane lipoprotein LpoB